MIRMSSMSKLPLRFSTEKRKWTRVGVCNSPPSKSRRFSKSKSPEPNCPICLGSIDGESFANGCFHSFCRTCLFEWSKVKAECPVCRRPFDNIIFNVESPEKYEQLKVKAQRPDPYQAPSTFSLYNGHPSRGFSQPHFNLFSNSPQSVSIRIGRTSQSNGHWLSGSSISRDVHSIIGHPPPPAWHQALSTGSFSRPSTVEFRRRLYRDNMWVKPDYQRTRASSASFYRNNPSLTHRLVPFVCREFSALINCEFEAQFLGQQVMAAILEHDIRSRGFRRKIENYLVLNTDHFIHEFYSYATSPYELNEYDIRSTYVPQSQVTVMTTVPPVPPLGINYEIDEPEVRPPRPTTNLSRIRNATASESSSHRLPIACIDLSDDSEDEESPAQLPSQPSTVSQAPTDTAAEQTTPPATVTADSDDSGSASSTRAQPEISLDINIIDDFDNPQPGPSGLNNRSNIQVNIKCASRRLMSFCDSDDGESDVENDSSKPHSFVPIFPSRPSETFDQDNSTDSIVFITEEKKPEPDVIDVSSDEEFDVHEEIKDPPAHSPPPTEQSQAEDKVSLNQEAKSEEINEPADTFDASSSS